MKKIKFILIALVLLIIFILSNFIIGDTGTTIENLESHARESHNISDDWSIAKDTSDEIGAMLFYNKALNSQSFSVYKTGISTFGKYRFIHGGVIAVMDEGVVEISYSETSKVLFSMNRKKINRIEFSKEDTIEAIEVDPEIPFVIILPSEFESYTLIDTSNNIVPIDLKRDF